MSGWFSKDLGDGILASVPLGRIEDRFRAAYLHAGAPKDMALFVRRQSDGRLHCEVTVYFTPAAASVARALDAVPCAKPSASGLEVVVGADDCWAYLDR